MKRRIILILIIVCVISGLACGIWWYAHNDNFKLLARARLAIRAGQVDKALELTRKYIIQHPDDWRGYYTLAQGHIKAGRYINAQGPLNEAIKLNPTGTFLFLELADTYALPAKISLAAQESYRDIPTLEKAIRQLRRANEILSGTMTGNGETEPRVPRGVPFKLVTPLAALTCHAEAQRA